MGIAPTYTDITDGPLLFGHTLIFAKRVRVKVRELPRPTSHLTTVTLLSPCPLGVFIIPHLVAIVKRFIELFVR